MRYRAVQCYNIRWEETSHSLTVFTNQHVHCCDLILFHAILLLFTPINFLIQLSHTAESALIQLSNHSNPMLHCSIFLHHSLFLFLPFSLFRPYFYLILTLSLQSSTQFSWYDISTELSLINPYCYWTLRPYRTLDSKIPWMLSTARVRVSAEEGERLLYCVLYCAALLFCCVVLHYIALRHSEVYGVVLSCAVRLQYIWSVQHNRTCMCCMWDWMWAVLTLESLPALHFPITWCDTNFINIIMLTEIEVMQTKKQM